MQQFRDIKMKFSNLQCDYNKVCEENENLRTKVNSLEERLSYNITSDFDFSTIDEEFSFNSQNKLNYFQD